MAATSRSKDADGELFAGHLSSWQRSRYFLDHGPHPRITGRLKEEEKWIGESNCSCVGYGDLMGEKAPRIMSIGEAQNPSARLLDR